MAVAARGIYSEPVGILRTMLSNCASFQKLVQAANAAAALSSIVSFGQSSDHARPFALIGLGDVPRESTSRGRFTPGGNLRITIEAPLHYEAAVTGATSNTVFACSSLARLADNFFSGMALEMLLVGALATETDTVSAFTGSTGTITLATGLSETPEVGSVCNISAADVNDALTFFMNAMGDIQLELEHLSGLGGNLNLHAIRLGDYGRPEREDDKDEYAGAVLEVAYGV
jgi:hypothetical protein